MQESLTADTSCVWAVAPHCLPCMCELWGVWQILVFWMHSSVDVHGGSAITSEVLSVPNRARQGGSTYSPAFLQSGVSPQSQRLTGTMQGAFPVGKNLGRERQKGGVGAGGSLGLSSTPAKVRYALHWRAVVPGCVLYQMFSVGRGSSMLILLAPGRHFASNAEKSALNLARQPRMEGSAPLSLSLSGEAWIRLPG